MTTYRTRLLALAALTLTTAAARAGYGSVSYVSRTNSSIRVTYTDPSGKIRYASGASYRFKICYKVKGTWGAPCSHNTRWSNSRPYNITGLTTNTKYKIRVYAWTERKIFGKWKNKKYRKVGTLVARTLPLTPKGDVFYLGWDDMGFGRGRANVRVDWNLPAEFDRIQIGYKMRGHTTLLDYTLKRRGRPATRWGPTGDNRPHKGWGAFNPTSTQSSFSFPWLVNCRSYIISAWAFRPGQRDGIKVDSVTFRAGGDCDRRLFRASGVLGADHSDVVHAWAQRLTKHYGGVQRSPIRAHLTKKFPEFARRLPALLEDGDVDANDYDLLEYVIAHEHALLDTWNKELAPLGLTLEQQAPAQLLSSIENELEFTAPTTIPRILTGQHANATNALPFGQTRGLMQSWHAGATIPKGAIRELGWRAEEDSTGAATKHRIEVVLANTPRTMSQMSRSFAANLPARPATFLPMTTISVPALSGTGNPNKAMVWVKGTRPFLFTGPNLVVQVRTETARGYASLRSGRTQALRQKGEALTLTSGWSCAGSLRFEHRPGAATLRVSGARPYRPIILMIGFDNTKLAGFLPLPMSLRQFGMGSCELSVDPVLQFTITAGADGTAAMRLPMKGIRELELHAQAMHFVQSTRSGLATTNAAHLLLGGGVTTQIYNLTRDGAVAEYGPSQTNDGPVLLAR